MSSRLNGGKACHGLAEVPVSRWLGLGLSALVAAVVWPWGEPMPVLGAEHAFVWSVLVGLAVVVAWQIMQAFVVGQSSGTRENVLFWLVAVDRALYAMLWGGVALRAEPLLTDFVRTQSPQVLIAALTGGGLVLAVAGGLKIPSIRGSSPSMGAGVLGVAGVLAAPLALSSRDRWRTCVHEAGHALVCAAVEELGNDFHVLAKLAVAPSETVAGHVSLCPESFPVQSARLAEFMMVLVLAGKAAETSVFGEADIGARSDHEAWVRHAGVVLSNFTEGVYYPNPANEHEVAHNSKCLASLYARHMAMLAEFFAMNGDRLMQVADMLKEKQILRGDDLAEVFDKVVWPEGFPTIHSVGNP